VPPADSRPGRPGHGRRPPRADQVRPRRRKACFATPTATPPATFLQLVWLASPALPVGGFSYSEGLEAAVESGLVHDETTAQTWLLDQLHLSLARSDLPVAAAAHRAWTRQMPGPGHVRLAELNTWIWQTRESSELRLQTRQMGRSLLDWLRMRDAADVAQGLSPDLRIADLADLPSGPTWPVAFALAASRAAAPAREALLAMAFGWCENQVQAALKAVPLGQSAGQRVLARLADALPAVVDRALTLPDSQRQAASPLLAILSSQHEAQYSRLFRS
jgi:urease accessory protein